jgi:hypothetical protein
MDKKSLTFQKKVDYSAKSLFEEIKNSIKLLPDETIIDHKPIKLFSKLIFDNQGYLVLTNKRIIMAKQTILSRNEVLSVDLAMLKDLKKAKNNLSISLHEIKKVNHIEITFSIDSSPPKKANSSHKSTKSQKTFPPKQALRKQQSSKHQQNKHQLNKHQSSKHQPHKHQSSTTKLSKELNIRFSCCNTNRENKLIHSNKGTDEIYEKINLLSTKRG